MSKLNILVIGGGGREHAIIDKLAASPRAGRLYAAPGNAGISPLAECLPIAAVDTPAGFSEVIAAVRERGIDLVFVAPDNPLCAGMVDTLREAGIRAFGPDKAAAEIEGSKVFSKTMMKKYGIPTAPFEIFNDSAAAIEYMRGKTDYPVFIKTDGLAFGKGAVAAHDLAEAEEIIRAMLEGGVFGASGRRIIIEECIGGASGREVSVLCFCDGEHILPMVSAQDHKRIFDGDKGPNTGGMGAFSPSGAYTPEYEEYCMERIFKPTMQAMKAEGRPFSGVLYVQLMLTRGDFGDSGTDDAGVYVIEYNARFGDPEAQVVLPRLKTDLIDIIEAAEGGRLDKITLEWDERPALCVVAASGGYPGEYKTGIKIDGLDKINNNRVRIYHAGTKSGAGGIVTAGGRVLCVSALGDDMESARALAYAGLGEGRINFEGMHFRRDIGLAGEPRKV